MGIPYFKNPAQNAGEEGVGQEGTSITTHSKIRGAVLEKEEREKLLLNDPTYNDHHCRKKERKKEKRRETFLKHLNSMPNGRKWKEKGEERGGEIGCHFSLTEAFRKEGGKEKGKKEEERAP